MPKPVLLVDDDPTAAFTVESMLQFLGVEVHMAENGRVALEKTAQTAYAAILMDIEMPEMDGLDATKAIRQRETGGDVTPIVGMTGHTSTGIRVLCERAGMNAVIVKPFYIETLKTRLTEVCGDALPMAENGPAT